MKLMLIFLMALTYTNELLAIPDNLLSEVDKRLQPESYESYRKLINIEPNGQKKEFVMYTIKKGQDKVGMYFLEPASDKGRTSLRVGDNMWLYIPGVDKPMRIASLQSVTGGVFNNADIMSLEYSVEYAVESNEEKTSTYLLNLKAKTPSVAYERLKMEVDKKSLYPVQIDCIANNIIIKTIRFLEPRDFGGFKRPSVLETTSSLQKGFKSIMIYAKIKKRKFNDSAFSLENMSKIGELR